MLRRNEDIIPGVRRNVHGGDGEVYSYVFLKPEEACNKGRLFSKTALPVGASIGMHRHEGEFEIYYVISGPGVANDGRQDYPLGPGDMYLCEDGNEHRLVNNGKEKLVFITIILYA